MAPPRLVYDDDCGFCTWAAEYAAARGEFVPVGFADLSPDQRARLPEEFESCAHLLTDERVYSCGAAAEETLCRMRGPLGAAAAAFRRLPGRERVRDPLYRFIAARRSLFGRLLRR